MSDYEVFISYSTKDKHLADAICSWLENNRIRCWMAPRNITPGIEYGEAIIEAIRQTKILIVVFTENANESKYVSKEVERAVNNGSVIIPVRFQDITPTKSMEFFLSSQHWLDILTPPLEDHLDKLVNSVKALLRSRLFVKHTDIVDNQKDEEDRAMFNELTPNDWFTPPKNKFSIWLHNLFTDKS